jgi:HEPN domain-containing protein
MKQTTNEWFLAAEDDLLAAKRLATDNRLTNVASFHCQQCIEKGLKAVIEEKGLPPLKSHDLFRLQLNAEIQLPETELILLGTINEVYIDSRYPSDFGLMPQGKPSLTDADIFIAYTEKLFNRLKNLIE